MSARDAIRAREQRKIRPEPEKPAKRPAKRLEPAEPKPGLDNVTTDSLPSTDG